MEETTFASCGGTYHAFLCVEVEWLRVGDALVVLWKDSTVQRDLRNVYAMRSLAMYSQQYSDDYGQEAFDAHIRRHQAMLDQADAEEEVPCRLSLARARFRARGRSGTWFGTS